MLEQAFDALKTYDWGVEPKALQPIHDAVIASHGDAAARKTLEEQLAAVLKTEVPRAAKDAICRLLRSIGTVASVPALLPLLADEKLAHMACYALERIPAPEAGNALRSALPKVSGNQKIVIMAALGVRGEDASIAPLQALMADSNPVIAQSAAFALGAIGSLMAAKTLVTATANPANKAAVADASMECAENLLVSGNKVAAKFTYEKLLASTPSKLVQDAATRGVQACAAK